MTQQQRQQAEDAEVVVRNHAVVTVQGEIRHYANANIGLNFEESTDEQVLDAVAAVVQEEFQIEMPKESFVVSRSQSNRNFVIYEKTELGSVDYSSHVSGEVKRFFKRNGSRAKKINIDDIDFHRNFTSVRLSLKNSTRTAVGYAKRNPNYDEFNPEVGLSIATFDAMRRLAG